VGQRNRPNRAVRKSPYSAPGVSKPNRNLLGNARCIKRVGRGSGGLDRSAGSIADALDPALLEKSVERSLGAVIKRILLNELDRRLQCVVPVAISGQYVGLLA
jgi:hypothetical protein